MVKQISVGRVLLFVEHVSVFTAFAYLGYLYQDIVIHSTINIRFDSAQSRIAIQFPKIPPAPCLPMQYAKEDKAVQPLSAITRSQEFLGLNQPMASTTRLIGRSIEAHRCS